MRSFWRFADSVRAAGPLEIERLVAPFAKSKSDKVGRSVIAALANSPALSNVRPETLQEVFKDYEPGVQEQTKTLYDLLAASTAERQAKIEELLTLSSQGDVKRGQLVFNSQKAACATCHAIGYLGGTVGPDLTHIGKIRSERDLLEAVVFPSASFVRSYEPMTITTRGGQVHNGIVRKDAPDEVVLVLNAKDIVRIGREDIDEMLPGTTSVMPTGLDKQLTAQELIDLVTFLARRSRPMPKQSKIFARSQTFCERFGLRVPILLAPMSGVSPPALSVAVANAGGLGACGALQMPPPAILQWASDVRAGTPGPFQINLWIPDPPPLRDAAHEARAREFLSGWGPAVPPEAGEPTLPDFAAQCDALLEAAPGAVSSVMGLYPAPLVAQLKQRGIVWIANVSTVAEARAAEEAGADVIAVQGMEAGGHRGCFDADSAERTLVGLFALVPAVVDAVRVPVVATGGIADVRGVSAALVLGASAVQIGTGFCAAPKRASIRRGPTPFIALRPRERC